MARAERGWASAALLLALCCGASEAGLLPRAAPRSRTTPPLGRAACRPTRLFATAAPDAAAPAGAGAAQPRGAGVAGGGEAGKRRRKGADSSCGVYPQWPPLPLPSDEVPPAQLMSTIAAMLLSVPLPVMGQPRT